MTIAGKDVAARLGQLVAGIARELLQVLIFRINFAALVEERVAPAAGIGEGFMVPNHELVAAGGGRFERAREERVFGGNHRELRELGAVGIVGHAFQKRVPGRFVRVDDPELTAVLAVTHRDQVPRLLDAAKIGQLLAGHGIGREGRRRESRGQEAHREKEVHSCLILMKKREAGNR